MKMVILILTLFNISLSQLYDLNKSTHLTKEREYFVNYANYLHSHNQFECSGKFTYHNIKKKTIEESEFNGVIFRNQIDTIANVSFLINFHNQISFYNNYSSYKFNKNTNKIYFEKINKVKFQMNNNVDFDIFSFFTSSDSASLEIYLKDDINLLYDTENDKHFYTIHAPTTNYLLSVIFRFKFDKSNYSPCYFNIVLNEYEKMPRFEEWFIENFKASKEIDTSKINFDEYLNKYPIYEKLVYKNKDLLSDSTFTGFSFIDNNLNGNTHKLIAIYQESQNLNEDYLLEDINKVDIDDLNVNIYKFENDTLFLKNSGVNEIVDFNLLHQYSVNYSPCFYLLDAENKIVDYFYGYNNTQRIDFNKILRGKLQ
jgi:hypothetical protein